MVIYIDVLLIENIIVNTFLLYITTQAVKVKVKFKYIIISGIIGSTYIFTLIYPKIKFLSSIPFKILAALIMILIVFRDKKIINIIKELFIFILFSMMLAGLCMFLQESGGINSEFGILINRFSYKYLLISIMIIYITISRLIIYIKDRREISSLIYDIVITTKNSEVKIKSFLDTGNGLREPVTNLPVILVEKIKFSHFDLSDYDKFYIPYRMADGSSGNLVGFKPEKIKINIGDNEEEKEAIIALCNNKLSCINEYQGLLSRGII
ncbi:MAG: sigma-E processing peptidase SpoIIGA [Bacillota bacterium]|nr:sigma-E processing peptidase SpoIIGA [Bacillota bacterium]